MDNTRVFQYRFAEIYRLYLQKVQRKGRTQDDLDAVLRWLTGLDEAQLRSQISGDATLEELFADASMPAAAAQITGVICGVRIENLDDPVMQKIRRMDKVVDELAKGRAVEKIMRS